MNGIVAYLPAAIFLCGMLAFNDFGAALMTLLAAAIHECGHAFAFGISAKRGERLTLRAVYDGFRFKEHGLLSYPKEILILASGPAANLAIYAICLFAGKGSGSFAVLNLLTAISNLLPVEGYDGYRILSLLFAARGKDDASLSVISILASAAIALTALFFVGKIGGGYWVFAVFFAGILRAMRKSGG